jgi:hypothetical protein
MSENKVKPMTCQALMLIFFIGYAWMRASTADGSLTVLSQGFRLGAE